MNAGRCVKGLKNFKFLETNRESNPGLQCDRIGSSPLDQKAKKMRILIFFPKKMNARICVKGLKT